MTSCGCTMGEWFIRCMKQSTQTFVTIGRCADFATGKRIEEPRRLTNWPSSCVYGGSATQDDKKITYTASSSFYTSYIADLKAGGTRVSNINHFTLEDSDDVIMDWTADDKSVIVAQIAGIITACTSSVSIPILRNRSCPPWPGA